MRCQLYCCLLLLFFPGCKKGNYAKVEIYMLRSFSANTDSSVYPATTFITNAVLADTPLVEDKDIYMYRTTSHTFKIIKDISPVIQHYGPDKAFAVTVDKQPVYFGKVHPLYLSSIVLGLATFAPESFSITNGLTIEFQTESGNPRLLQLDKRNDPKIILPLKSTGRVQ